MEHPPQKKIESQIQHIELAMQGAKAELDETETLLRKAEKTKIRLEAKIRNSANYSELISEYQTVLTEIIRLNRERDMFARDLEKLQAELKWLSDH